MSRFPLSPYREAGNLLFVSGQIGQQDGALVADDVTGQVEQAVRNIQEILQLHGLDLQDVLDVSAFLVSQDDYAAFNEAYAACFQEPYPSRTTVTVQSLPLNARVELKVIAFKK